MAKKLTRWTLVMAAALCAPVAILADEKPAQPPTREEIRELLKDMTPEQREAKMKELREKFGTASPAPADRPGLGGRGNEDERREAYRKAMEELRDLSPEERAAKIKELREKYSGGQPGPGREMAGGMSPEKRQEFQKYMQSLGDISREERQAKALEWMKDNGVEAPKIPDRTAMRENLEAQIKELEKKKADGTLSPEETTRLERMQAMMKGADPSRSSFRDMTPEERLERAKEGRGQLEARIKELEKKKADGTITEQEQQMLSRFERFRQGSDRPERGPDKK